MVYLWEIPETFLNRDVGEYNRDCSPDRFLLRKGCKLSANEFTPKPTVNFEITKKRVLKFDCLPNNSQIPLVNHRTRAILENLAPNDVQFFPVKLICSDGEMEGYYFLNLTHTIKGIDHEKSIYTKMKAVDAISGFHYLKYREDCMGEHQLALDQEYRSHILVSEKIKSVFDKERITGVWLVRPEEYYNGPVTAKALINEYKRDKGET